MLGAIIGDIVGSRFERDNCHSTDFELFTPRCTFTDDTVMTLAVAQALMEYSKQDSYQGRWNSRSLSEIAVKCMKEVGLRYPNCGYGSSFYLWLHRKDPKPYQSFGNGSAMRVSPVAYMTKTLDECIELADAVTCVSHDHPEGMKGAEATAAATWAALQGWSKTDIRNLIEDRYYILDYTINDIRPAPRFDATCQVTVPQAIIAFLESENFEDAIRLAVSIGGDSDTIAAIAGAIAGAYYNIPLDIWMKADKYLTKDLKGILNRFFAKIPAGLSEENS